MHLPDLYFTKPSSSNCLLRSLKKEETKKLIATIRLILIITASIIGLLGYAIHIIAFIDPANNVDTCNVRTKIIYLIRPTFDESICCPSDFSVGLLTFSLLVAIATESYLITNASLYVDTKNKKNTSEIIKAISITTISALTALLTTFFGLYNCLNMFFYIDAFVKLGVILSILSVIILFILSITGINRLFLKIIGEKTDNSP